ncbi:MAG: serine O-acetyltransferase EpsC [Candidatus Ranarchaeia archaeon]
MNTLKPDMMKDGSPEDTNMPPARSQTRQTPQGSSTPLDEDSWSQESLPGLVQKIMESYSDYPMISHLTGKELPSKQVIIKVLGAILELLFPGYQGRLKAKKPDIRQIVEDNLSMIYEKLSEEVEKSFIYIYKKEKQCDENVCRKNAKIVVQDLLDRLPEIRRKLQGDVQAAYDGDPAASSTEEVLLSYPCIFAIATYRIAHELFIRKVPLIPRMMTEYAHSVTGIDIHPGAKIGCNFFIDHGTGVVIGETTEIGDNVKIYQGVTLGALSFPKDERGCLIKGYKRHPTIGDNVVIYANATLLGGKTTIGEGAVIGGNVWITSSIAPNTKVAIVPPELHFKTKTKR